MNRVPILLLVWMISANGEAIKIPPVSPDAVEGQSVYVPPAPSVDVAEEGCVQKEDQNLTGHGSAKW